jgi:hypothetical protein
VVLRGLNESTLALVRARERSEVDNNPEALAPSVLFSNFT